MSKRKEKLLDWTATVTIVLTLVLFVVALFVKGLTHDILLEAAVFLVSAKLIVGAYRNNAMTQRLETKLSEIESLLRK